MWPTAWEMIMSNRKQGNAEERRRLRLPGNSRTFYWLIVNIGPQNQSVNELITESEGLWIHSQEYRL